MKNLFKNKKIIVGLALLVAVGGWFAFGRKPKVEYVAYPVETKTIQDTLELSGDVKAERSATLRFGAGGLLTYLGPKEGDSVKKWQTIARIDSRQLQKILEQKLNSYAIQRSTFDQTVDDNNNSVPDGDVGRTLQRLLAKNQYQLENTVKDVEYQQLAVSLTGIYSPFDGILVHAPVTTSGINVLPTDTWTLIDPDSLYFSATLDETDLKRVSLGQKTEVKLDAFPDMLEKSQISYIGYTPVETTTGTTYEVKIALTPANLSQLRLGLNGTASVILAEKENVLVLPASAVNSKNGISYVLVKEGDKYRDQTVKTGIENGGMVEIESGVTNGETIYQVK